MSRLVSALVRFCQVHAFAVLLLSYLLFVALGGLVLTAVEKPRERELRVQVEEVRRSFLQENPCVREERLRELLGKALTAHHSHVAVLKAEADEGNYDFRSSLFFVIVTLTTMGSDTYILRSEEAKLFFIFYCTLGIPLTLLLLTLLSRALLLVVTHSPVHRLRSSWGLPYAQAALIHAILLSLLVLSLLFLLPALLVCAVEPGWSLLDALFFCLVTLSTVGQGGNSLGRGWSPGSQEALELLTTSYLLLGLVVIITLKDTVLQVPQVRAVIRLFSGPQYGELDGSDFNELSLSDDQCEEDSQYSQSICTIYSSPLRLISSSSDQPADPDPPTTSTT